MSGGQPRRHERVADELAWLAEEIQPGRLGASREVSEALLRVVGFVVRLHDEHEMGRRGWCVACGRWRRCPVLDAESVHFTLWLGPRRARRAAAGDAQAAHADVDSGGAVVRR